MTITTTVKKPRRAHSLRHGITAQPHGVRIVCRFDLYEVGFVDVIVLIGRDSFSELAQAMIKTNAKDSIKAFGIAQANI
jgi:hypothetical protein